MTQLDKLFSLEALELIACGGIKSDTRTLALELAASMRENERLRKFAKHTHECRSQIVGKCICGLDDIPNKHTVHSSDGGCQMPRTAIAGYCCVCGSPNRTCQPEKQPTQNIETDEEGNALNPIFINSTKTP